MVVAPPTPVPSSPLPWSAFGAPLKSLRKPWEKGRKNGRVVLPDILSQEWFEGWALAEECGLGTRQSGDGNGLKGRTLTISENEKDTFRLHAALVAMNVYHHASEIHRPK